MLLLLPFFHPRCTETREHWKTQMMLAENDGDETDLHIKKRGISLWKRFESINKNLERSCVEFSRQPFLI